MYGDSQKNSAENLFNSLEKLCRPAELNATELVWDETAREVLSFLEGALGSSREVSFDIGSFEIRHNNEIVYSSKDKKTSLAFALHQDGIRSLIFKRGLEKNELWDFVQILSSDFSLPELMDQDLYCLIFEKQLPHIEVQIVDVLADVEKTEPKLYLEISAFEKKTKEVKASLKMNGIRRLRSDDLKVLEEFRLNPLHFTRADEEISKVIRSLIQARDAEGKEQETLERLLAMGFHFLLSERESEQVRVGRDLLTRIAIMILEAELFDLFEKLMIKIHQLRKENADRSGEYQKILDFVFNPDRLELFDSLLQEVENQKALSKILLGAPGSGVRLVILLLGQHSWLTKISSEYVLKNISGHMNWVLAELQRSPQNKAWIQLVFALTTRPSLHFQKVTESLLRYGDAKTRTSVLNHLSTLTTLDGLQVIEQVLQSDREQDRLQLYDSLKQSRNLHAVKFLKAHFESKRMDASADPREKESLLSTILLVEGKDVYPWVELMWLKPATGFFHKKIENERRLQMISVLARWAPDFIPRLFEKTPRELLTPEIQSAAARKLEDQSAPVKEVAG